MGLLYGLKYNLVSQSFSKISFDEVIIENPKQFLGFYERLGFSF